MCSKIKGLIIIMSTILALTGCDNNNQQIVQSNDLIEDRASEIVNIDEQIYFTPSDSSKYKIDEESGIEYVDNELILIAEEGTIRSDIEKLLEEYEAQIIGYIEPINTYQISLKSDYSYKELLEIKQEITKDELFSSSEVNVVISIDANYYPNDMFFENDWDKIPSGRNWGIEAIDVPGAWDYMEYMKMVNIGVFDTIFYNHEDLEFKRNLFSDVIDDQFLPDRFVNHGMSVAGIISAGFDNKKGISGIVPYNNLSAISYCGFVNINEPNSFQDIAKVQTSEIQDEGIKISLVSFKAALVTLIVQENDKVINISMGNDVLQFAASRGNVNARYLLNFISQSISKTLQSLINEGYDFIICISAGNINDENNKFIKTDNLLGYDILTEDNIKYYREIYKKDFSERTDWGNVEAKYDFMACIDDEDVKDRIIVVGAIANKGGENYELAGFSCSGDRVDIVAPGVKIFSLTKDGYTQKDDNGKVVDKAVSGTSFASPHVAGVAGLLFSVNPELTGPEVKDIICKTGEGKYYYNLDSYYTMVNAKNAVAFVVDSGLYSMQEEKGSTDTYFEATEADFANLELLLTECSTFIGINNDSIFADGFTSGSIDKTVLQIAFSLYNYHFDSDGIILGDPLNKMYTTHDQGHLVHKEGIGYPGEQIDWIIEHILHTQPNHSIENTEIPDARQRQSWNQFYYDNGYYYFGISAMMGADEARVTDYAKLDDGKYFVEFELYELSNYLARKYAIVTLEEIDEKTYWTVYSISSENSNLDLNIKNESAQAENTEGKLDLFNILGIEYDKIKDKIWENPEYIKSVVSEGGVYIQDGLSIIVTPFTISDIYVDFSEVKNKDAFSIKSVTGSSKLEEVIKLVDIRKEEFVINYGYITLTKHISESPIMTVEYVFDPDGNLATMSCFIRQIE